MSQQMLINGERVASVTGEVFDIQDPATGRDAVSVIDEDRLEQLSEQLGLPYLHRVAGESVLPAVDTVDLNRYASTEELERERISARRELYWPLLIGVAGVALWEIGAGFAGLVQARGRRGPT